MVATYRSRNISRIGFIMSVFIALLAFNDAAVQDIAKVGVLIASLLAALIGYIWLYIMGKEARL